MDKATELTIYEAALRTSRQMGEDLLRMSCFASNWRETSAVEADSELEFA